MSNSYEVGEQVICQAIFTLVSTGAVTDPTNVFFQYKTPTGSGTGIITTWQYGVDPEVAKLSTGTYTATINITRAGEWYYRWYSTGTGMAATENVFNVVSSEFD